MPRFVRPSLPFVLPLAVHAGIALAQPAPAPAPAAPATPPQQVEITGGRQLEVQERRQSTAAKIVIGREEIERFGDSTLAEVLKRLPGVTAPGGGRGIRMRGLGAGYTQILIDGERMPPGFSLDSLNPDQVERIEILRAPTAETGTRAMAGTINIITRDGYAKRLNDLHATLGWRHGRSSPALSWTRNGGSGPFSFNLSLSAMAPRSASDSAVTTTRHDTDGSVLLQQREQQDNEDRRHGLHASGRLQWRLGEQGDSLVLMPFLMRWQGSGTRTSQLQTLAGTPPTCPPATPDCSEDPSYDHARSVSDNTFTLARLNGQGRFSLGETRLELRAGLGDARNDTHSLRREFDAGDALLDTVDEHTRSQERSHSAALKASRVLSSGHSLVAGAEWEQARREEQGTRNGAPVLADADNLQASSRRLAAFLQDEWNATPQWALQLGARWEGIRTTGDGVDLAAGGATEPVHNSSSVFTPVLHAVWKFDAQRRDQLRLSLTRSYKSPTTQQLIGRPSFALHNSQTRPDRVGNPALEPELASGIDLAVERYLEGGGLLSANLFHRRISDLIRTVTTLETAVPWASGERWVAQPRNLDRAWTQGLELEAKFRLNDFIAAAPAVDLRGNASFYRSRVSGVPGPDNRLDQQPGASLNAGADWRWRGTPLAFGGNLAFTPGYSTQLSATQRLEQARTRAFDAYAVWTIDPAWRLRVSASNLLPLDERSVSIVGLQSAETVSTGRTGWQLRLEAKL